MDGIKKDKIVTQVIDKFQSRSDLGIKKYNTTLEENNGGAYYWLNHLQEELMDATLYIEKLKTKIQEIKELELKLCENENSKS